MTIFPGLKQAAGEDSCPAKLALNMQISWEKGNVSATHRSPNICQSMGSCCSGLGETVALFLDIAPVEQADICKRSTPNRANIRSFFISAFSLDFEDPGIH